MATGNCHVSERCLRYKNMDFPLLDYMNAYLQNKYEKETNPQVKVRLYIFPRENILRLEANKL